MLPGVCDFAIAGIGNHCVNWVCKHSESLIGNHLSGVKIFGGNHFMLVVWKKYSMWVCHSAVGELQCLEDDYNYIVKWNYLPETMEITQVRMLWMSEISG